MPFIVIVAVVCLGLSLLLPRAFKVATGAIVGVAVGGLAWALAAMALPCFVSLAAFGAFLVVGIVCACALLASR